MSEEEWRIPEWQQHWKDRGAQWAYINTGDLEALPEYRQALEEAKKAGTAHRIR